MSHPLLSPALDRLAARLLHPRLRTGDVEERFVGRVALWLVLGGLSGALFVNIYFLATDDLRLAWAHLGFLAAVLLAPLFTRHIGTVRAVQGYVVGLTWAMVTLVVALTGGATSSALYFYALVPFFGAALGGHRGGMAGFVVGLLCVCAFYGVHLAGARLPAEGVYALMIDPPSVAAAALLVYGISVGFVRSRQDCRAQAAAATRAVAAANQRAEAARAVLERARDAKLVALTRVGDGLHTPLVRIADAARRLRDGLPAALHDHATMVERSADRLLFKLDAFVIASNAWASEPGVVASFDVAVAVRDVVAAHHASATAKGVDLRLAAHGPDPGARRGDRPRIQRILAELVDNAVKHTSDGEVELAVTVDAGDDRVSFEVRDTGAGIAPADLERVFEPLFRGDASSTQRHGGTGLGLAVARRIAEGLGGELICRSERGVGTRMVLTLPLSRDVDQPRVTR